MDGLGGKRSSALDVVDRAGQIGGGLPFELAHDLIEHPALVLIEFAQQLALDREDHGYDMLVVDATFGRKVEDGAATVLGIGAPRDPPSREEPRHGTAHPYLVHGGALHHTVGAHGAV